MKDKNDRKGTDFTAEREKDADIHLLVQINRELKKMEDTKFILTGSYAIEALTGQKAYHEDIDANIYAAKIDGSLPRVATKMKEFTKLELYKRTADRLEYDIIPDTDRASVKRLEFQFNLPNQKSKIPIVLAPLTDSQGKEFLFSVKTLPYVLATWSIRISGLATNPKRALKNSDLEQFKLLLACNHDVRKVINIIKKHPQAPLGTDATKIFEQSISKLGVPQNISEKITWL